MFPGIIIRLCQFPIFQALLRWSGEAPDKGTPKIPVVVRTAVAQLFRHLQRYRARPEDANPDAAWDKAVETFREVRPAIQLEVDSGYLTSLDGRE